MLSAKAKITIKYLKGVLLNNANSDDKAIFRVIQDIKDYEEYKNN